MIRYTTESQSLYVKGVDLTQCDVYVTYRQADVTMEVTDVTVTFDGTDTLVVARLTQEQTARLQRGYAKVQINYVDVQGHRDATVEKEFYVHGNLLQRVLTHAS